MDLLPFMPNDADSCTVDTAGETPKDLDLFFRDEWQFLPEGKTWADLPPEEAKILRDKYRFDPLKPGLYQAISGISTAQH